jgi:hypothetical protein
MNVEIDGQKVTVPICTCGKCLVKRLRKNFFTNFPYNKNLSSTYVTDYPARNPLGTGDTYNRAKHSAFEGMYKEHLPTCLMSTMKYDYKPFKVKTEDTKPTETRVESIPFYGRSSYDTHFPNWGSTLIGKEKPVQLPEIKVPLRGVPNYKENYIAYDPDFYRKRDPTNFAKDTLQFFGKVHPETTYGTSFKPVDFNQPHYFPKDKFRKTDIEKTSLIPTDFATPETFYQTDYKPYDHRCKLAEYLRHRGMNVLEI